jgi:hypothetical protein
MSSIESNIIQGGCGDFILVCGKGDDGRPVPISGKDDVERPDGQWNTMEAICDGDRITVYLNNVLVNKMTNASLTSGKITIQSELAEIHIRRLELLPLDPQR